MPWVLQRLCNAAVDSLTTQDKTLLVKVPVTGWAQPTKESSNTAMRQALTDIGKERIATIQAVEDWFAYQGLTQALGALLD